jgi:glutathione S-transferase
MLLIGQYDSPYVRRVAVSMHLLGVPFERAPISTFREVERMREMNPTLRIPALVLDDGEILTDSSAILDWLDDEAGPERALMPAHGPLRRRCWQIVGSAVTTNDKARDVVYERGVRPPEKVHEPWIARCREQLEAALTALDRHEPHPWLLGERLTQADVTVACTVSFLRKALPEALPAGRYPNLERLEEACEALPAFVACRSGDEERPLRG